MQLDHHIDGAMGVVSATDDGTARFTAEVRSPRTLFSAEFSSRSSTHQISWDTGDVDEERGYLLGGVTVVSEAARLEAGQLNPLLRTQESLAIPPGWHLASAMPRRLKRLLGSIVKYREDSKLEAGRMRVLEDASTDAPLFRVWCASDVFAVIRGASPVDPTIRLLRQQVGLVGVCALLPQSSLSDRCDGKFADHTATHSLAAKFAELGVGHWDDETFDPLAAATAWISVISVEAGDTEEARQGS